MLFLPFVGGIAMVALLLSRAFARTREPNEIGGYDVASDIVWYDLSRTGAKDALVSAHFKLGDFVGNQRVTTVPISSRLIAALEWVRAAFGNRALVITSGFRTEERNRLVGGVKNSYHLRGMAADFVIPGVAHSDIQKFLLTHWYGVGAGGVGRYKTFTHIDVGVPRTWKG